MTWRVDNRNYSVVHFFPESDRVSGNQLIFALGEFYRDSVENGYISHHEVSGFAKNKRGILFNQKKRYSTLYRINDDSSEQIWTWNNKRNEAGKKIGRVFPAHIMYAKEGLEVRILKKDMNSKKTNGDVLLQSVETCVEQKLPDSWSSTFGDNKLKVGLKKIDRLVTHLRAIDGIYQKCLALEGQENCQDEKTQKERIKSKITKTWKTLYKLPKTERRKKYRFSRNRLSKYSEARSRVYRTLDRLEVGWVLEQGFIDYLSKN